jgi:hypothetical protein
LRRSSTGSRRGGTKAQARLEGDGLDWAVADVAGSGAAEALDDGPCCRLSVVANRGDKRLRYEVLEHEPPHEDIRALLGR